MRSFVAVFALLFSLHLTAQSTAPSAPEKSSDPAAVREVGGSVLPPTLQHQVDPKYPRPVFGRPRPAHVLLGLVVDPQGLPTRIHVVQSGGGDFDKSAIKAVEQYRFGPATENGKPVPVEIRIDVQFHIERPPAP